MQKKASNPPKKQDHLNPVQPQRAPEKGDSMSAAIALQCAMGNQGLNRMLDCANMPDAEPTTVQGKFSSLIQRVEESMNTGALSALQKENVPDNRKASAENRVILQGVWKKGKMTIPSKHIKRYLNKLDRNREQYKQIADYVAGFVGEFDLEQYSSMGKGIIEIIEGFRSEVEGFDLAGKYTDRVVNSPVDVKTGKPKNWGFKNEESLDLGESIEDGESLFFAHNAYGKDNFENKEVLTKAGTEFGSGFYTTTGHETGPQRRIHDHFTAGSGKHPNVIIRFKLDKELLRRELGSDLSDPEWQLVLHMIKHAQGYPEGMDENQAYLLMNSINRKGKIMLLPDDKSKKVTLDDKTEVNWDDFYGGENQSTFHQLVIGPQKPHELEGVRQIAFRHVIGMYLINMAERFDEKI